MTTKKVSRILVIALACLAAVGVCFATGILPVHHNTSLKGPASPKPSSVRHVAGSDSAAVKPIIAGLLDRQAAPASKALAYIHAYVVKVNWADIQPTAGGPLVANNAIDKAIIRVREPDFAAVGMKLKLRVFTGVQAPQWAKSLGGPPISYLNNNTDAGVAADSIGRFWTPEYEAAYATLQSDLAAKYDSVPEIREVTVSGCSTYYDEPFVRQPGETGNASHLETAGYSQTADQGCISKAIDAHTVWAHTTSDLDLSPFPNALDPNASRNLAYTVSMMSVCRKVLGSRCGLQNNALSSPKLADPDFTSMYKAMQALGKPLVFQTAAVARLGDPQQTLEAGVAMHADSIELPVGYQSWSPTLLAKTEAGLIANAAG